MKTKPKPRVMWAWPSHLNARACPIWASRSKMHRGLTQSPLKVAVIPLDDIEALVERAAKAIYVNARRWEGAEKCNLTWETTFQKVRDAYLIDARAALTAAGIPCKQRRAKR